MFCLIMTFRNLNRGRLSSLDHQLKVLLISDFIIYSNTYLNSLADGHGRSGADNRSAGADHPATHDPSSWETTPVGVFRHLRPPGILEPKESR